MYHTREGVPASTVVPGNSSILGHLKKGLVLFRALLSADNKGVKLPNWPILLLSRKVLQSKVLTFNILIVPISHKRLRREVENVPLAANTVVFCRVVDIKGRLNKLCRMT